MNQWNVIHCQINSLLRSKPEILKGYGLAKDLIASLPNHNNLF